MQEITPQEWYELLETVHKLEDRSASLMAVIIIAFVIGACWCLLSWVIEQEKKPKKKDKQIDNISDNQDK